MVGCQVSIHGFVVHTRRSSAPVISAVVSEAVHKAMSECGVVLSEPIMRLDISSPPEHTGTLFTLCLYFVHIMPVSYSSLVIFICIFGVM